MSTALDRLVSEKVMGWPHITFLAEATADGYIRLGTPYRGADHPTDRCGKWSPSTDIAAAWEVRAEMKRRGWNLHIDDYGNRVRANFSKDMLYDWRNNREHANECVSICLAALAVCGVPESEIQEAMR